MTPRNLILPKSFLRQESGVYSAHVLPQRSRCRSHSSYVKMDVADRSCSTRSSRRALRLRLLRRVVIGRASQNTVQRSCMPRSGSRRVVVIASPVIGLLRWLRNQSSIASRSYVWPCTVRTGSRKSCKVMGQHSSSGGSNDVSGVKPGLSGTFETCIVQLSRRASHMASSSLRSPLMSLSVAVADRHWFGKTPDCCITCAWIILAKLMKTPGHRLLRKSMMCFLKAAR